MMNELTEVQVSAAFETVGMKPVASAASIALVLSAQFAATGPAFAAIPFDVEPCSFAVLILNEKD